MSETQRVTNISFETKDRLLYVTWTPPASTEGLSNYSINLTSSITPVSLTQSRFIINKDLLPSSAMAFQYTPMLISSMAPDGSAVGSSDVYSIGFDFAGNYLIRADIVDGTIVVNPTLVTITEPTSTHVASRLWFEMNSGMLFVNWDPPTSSEVNEIWVTKKYSDNTDDTTNLPTYATKCLVGTVGTNTGSYTFTIGSRIMYGSGYVATSPYNLIIGTDAFTVTNADGINLPITDTTPSPLLVSNIFFETNEGFLYVTWTPPASTVGLVELSINLGDTRFAASLTQTKFIINRNRLSASQATPMTISSWGPDGVIRVTSESYSITVDSAGNYGVTDTNGTQLSVGNITGVGVVSITSFEVNDGSLYVNFTHPSPPLGADLLVLSMHSVETNQDFPNSIYIQTGVTRGSLYLTTTSGMPQGAYYFTIRPTQTETGLEMGITSRYNIMITPLDGSFQYSISDSNGLAINMTDTTPGAGGGGIGGGGGGMLDGSQKATNIYFETHEGFLYVNWSPPTTTEYIVNLSIDISPLRISATLIQTRMLINKDWLSTSQATPITISSIGADGGTVMSSEFYNITLDSNGNYGVTEYTTAAPVTIENSTSGWGTASITSFEVNDGFLYVNCPPTSFIVTEVTLLDLVMYNIETTQEFRTNIPLGSTRGSLYSSGMPLGTYNFVIQTKNSESGTTWGTTTTYSITVSTSAINNSLVYDIMDSYGFYINPIMASGIGGGGGGGGAAVPSNTLAKGRTLAYGNGLWLAAGDAVGSNNTIKSTDGVNWTPAGNPLGDSTLTIKKFANGLDENGNPVWIVVGDAGIRYSSDAITWTSPAVSPFNGAESVVFLNDPNKTWVALGYNQTIYNETTGQWSSKQLARSTDGGKTWQLNDFQVHAPNGLPTSMKCIAHGEDAYGESLLIVAGGVNGLSTNSSGFGSYYEYPGGLISSDKGVTWSYIDSQDTKQIIPAEVTQIKFYKDVLINGVNFPRLWVACTDANGYMSISTDGINWTWKYIPNLYKIFDFDYNEGLWILAVTSYSGAPVVRSTDLETYTDIVENIFPRSAKSGVIGILYGNNRFVALGGDSGLETSGNIPSSRYGIVWNLPGNGALSETENNIMSAFVKRRLALGYNASGPVWLAAGSNIRNTVYVQRSTDGVTWNNVLDNKLTLAYDVAFGDGSFVVVGNSGIVVTTDEGLTFAKVDTPAGALFRGVAYSAGIWIAVGTQNGNAIVYKSTSLDIMNWTDVVSEYASTGYQLVGVKVLNTICAGENGLWFTGGKSDETKGDTMFTINPADGWSLISLDNPNSPENATFKNGTINSISYCPAMNGVTGPKYIATGYSVTLIGTPYFLSHSMDGIVWTNSIISEGGVSLGDIKQVSWGLDYSVSSSGNPMWIVVGKHSNLPPAGIYYGGYAISENGSSWQVRQLEDNFIPSCVAWGTYGNYQKWVIGGNSVTSSSDLVTWGSAGTVILAPGPVVDLSGVASGTTVTLSWRPPVSNGGSEINYYTVQEANGLIGLFNVVANTNFQNGVYTVAIPNLPGDGTYTFFVTPNNLMGQGQSSMTGQLSFIPITAPGAPADLSGVAVGTTINLSWRPPASDGGSGITKYHLSELNARLDLIIVNMNSISISLLDGSYHYSISNLPSNSSYTFVLAAYNVIGRGDQTTSPEITTQSSIVPEVPGAPTNITAIPSATSALVSWTPPASSGSSPITAYKVYCQPDNKLPNTADATATSLNVTGLKNGTSYTFAVVAINSVGSSYMIGCTPSTLPSVPKVTAVVANGQATVSWVSKVAKGVPTTGYTLTCNQDVTLPTNPTSPVVITGLTNGTSYVFSVRATNAIGTSAAGASKAVVPVGPPSIPNNVTVLGGMKSFQVNWAASTTNGGLPITEYTITYVGGGKTTVAKGKGVAPYTLMVTKLVTGTVYTVTMVAKNKVGVSAATSAVTVTVE